MPNINVNVKWGQTKHNLDADTDESPQIFKAQLFELTGVPLERMKIMFKGKNLTDDNWDNFLKAGLKKGETLMMMGSADALPEAPKSKPMFLEEMNESQMAQVMDFPIGLKNLGNTCYMNATLQCLRAIPELNSALEKYQVRSVNTNNSIIQLTG